uniref:Uncharacterized protein n=1 Tax=Tetradesmus obliquus TaxID=3088 RepID=A0A383V3N6_TETOB|eukprot:jgi/Sobl393_1/7762/SZX59530.1
MAQPGSTSAAAAPAAAPAAANVAAAATSPASKLDFDGLAAQYNELVGAIAATIDPVAGKEGPMASAKRLGTLREQFIASCNDLTDELAALQQRVALQPPPEAAAMTPAQQQQQQQAQQLPSTALGGAGDQQVDAMDVDAAGTDPVVQQQQQQQQQQLAAQLAQQHHSFVQQLRPAVHQG